jgi:hypothetical protein
MAILPSVTFVMIMMVPAAMGKKSFAKAPVAYKTVKSFF